MAIEYCGGCNKVLKSEEAVCITEDWQFIHGQCCCACGQATIEPDMFKTLGKINVIENVGKQIKCEPI